MKCKNCGHKIEEHHLFQTIMKGRICMAPVKTSGANPFFKTWDECGCNNPEPKEALK